jgi:hypothetical protein
MKELQKSLKRLGKIPQKHVTSSAKKGMNIPLKESKSTAPYETGNLKQGIILVGEKSRQKGKKVYRIVFDRSKNNIFQKRNKDGKITGYYPVSQEYGFFTTTGRYIPGFRFIHDSLTKNTQKVSSTIIKTMKDKIDKQIAKEGLT